MIKPRTCRHAFVCTRICKECARWWAETNRENSDKARKRTEAEARNAKTPIERTAAYRRNNGDALSLRKAEPGSPEYDYLDGVNRMPEAGRLFQSLGFFLLGIAATAAFAWLASKHGSSDRRAYGYATVGFALAGCVSLLADMKLRYNERLHSSWVADYMERCDPKLTRHRYDSPDNQRDTMG